MNGTWACGLCAQQTFCLLFGFQRASSPLGAQVENLCSRGGIATP
jgi:hypothetical protein